jgi:hypothetical protein
MDAKSAYERRDEVQLVDIRGGGTCPSERATSQARSRGESDPWTSP